MVLVTALGVFFIFRYISYYLKGVSNYLKGIIYYL